MSTSHLEIEFLQLWQLHYPEIELFREVKIVPKRKFSFDFAYLPRKVAIEIQGKIWRLGRHSSGTGLVNDYTKNNLAQSQGWLVFQLADKMITSEWVGIIANTIRQRDLAMTTSISQE